MSAAYDIAHFDPLLTEIEAAQLRRQSVRTEREHTEYLRMALGRPRQPNQDLAKFLAPLSVFVQV
jgi:hypothetical protein